MKITLESTSKVVELNGIPARIWEGETGSGIRVHAYVTRLAVAEGQDQQQFKDELQQCQKPSAEIEAIPLRMII